MSIPSPTPSSPPTLYEWAGGLSAFERMTDIFYRRVQQDTLLAPVFATMSAEHSRHVAAFIAEVLGGPTVYSGVEGQGHAEMIRHHLGRHLTEEQRRRWIEMILDSADEAGLPDDPEFRSALVGYLEWGSRLAVINSKDGASAPPNDSPMPRWGWGEVGGPYKPG